MKLTLLISVFSLTIGAPFSSTVENEYPDSDEESGDPKENNVDPISFKNIQLDKGCTIAWKIMGESLLLSLKLSRVNKWLVVGFADVDNSLDQLEQTLFLRIRRTKPIAAKSADWTPTDGFFASKENVWEKESLSGSSDTYNAIISRPLEGLNENKPLKLVFAFGNHQTFQEINKYFKNLFAVKYIILSKPGVFLTKSEAELLVSSKGKPTSEILNATKVLPGNSTSKSAELATTTTTTTTTIAAFPKTEIPEANINEGHSEVLKTTEKAKPSQITTTRQPVIIRARTTDKVTSDHKTVKSTDVGVITTKPCPVICNCTKGNGNNTDSHWYDVIRAKENATYFAIIGGSALFTGIIVLCVACCCARSGRVPVSRTRKHKVAFYKVDDFDSEGEEEIDDLISEKGA